MEKNFDSLSDAELKEKIEVEIKENIQEAKKSLKSKIPHFSPIDSLTKIDDLLRENIILQRDLIKRVHTSNQLLMALYYKREKNGEIVPINNGIDTSAILKGLKTGDNYKTMVKNIQNPKITGSESVFEIKGTGILAEVKFQSSNANVNNKAYNARILSDKDIIYNGTWSNFESRSYYEADMTCYEDAINGYYILSFKKVAYLKNLKIEVYESSASFINIYIKYHEKS